MRIIVVGTRGFPGVQGGVEIHCENLYPRLVALGCEVIVFTRRTYVDESIKEYNGVKLIALPIIRNKYLEAFFHTLIGVLASIKYKPDILHIQAIGPALFTPLARILGMKVVVTSHGSNYKHLKWGKFAKIILRIGEFTGVKFANGLIVISKTIASEIDVKYKRKAAIISNGVNIPNVINSTAILEEFKLQKSKYILAVGRLVPEKGFLDLIEAFDKLNPDDWKLVIAGQADHKDSYSQKIIDNASKSKKIVLPGFVSGIPLQELYANAGLFVIPSYYEGMPIALLEAMSYGLSCIASDIPANKEIGLPAERYFKPGDIQSIIGKMEHFMAGFLTCEEKKKQIESLRNKYDWGKIAIKTLEVYNNVTLGR